MYITFSTQRLIQEHEELAGFTQAFLHLTWSMCLHICSNYRLKTFVVLFLFIYMSCLPAEM